MAAILSLAVAAPASAQAPIVRTITRDWTFTYQPDATLDPAPAAADFDDRAWPAVALPHSWSLYETTGDLHPFIKAASERDDPYWWRGWGWYRKHLTLAPALRGQRIFVEFDGVQKYSRIYLNGAFVAEHKGGYTSFSVDVTEHVRFGADNVLAVAVSNRRDDLQGGIAPMTAGNFDVYGGIYRDVRLVVKDPLHFPYQGSADHEGGVWITTPEVSVERATVRVRTWVRNDGAAPQEAALRTEIRDPAGKVVATLAETRTIAAGAVEAFNQRSGPIATPQLWSPDAPHLYRVTSTLVRGGKPVERLDNPLGFRWFRWDHASNRLILNGKPILINGTNRHQDYPWLGDAIPKRLHAREMTEIRRDLGHNFIRTAHYPNDPIVYDLTDRLGLITVEEVPNIKAIDFGEEIQRANLTEMIRRDRNHPSILFWSVGNETDDPVDSCIAKQLDPDRLIHARKSENAGNCVDHDHSDLDMENLLRVTIRGWETEEAVTGAAGRPMRSPNGQTAGTEAWAHAQAQVDDGSIRGRIDRQGVAWIYADHGADRRYENAPLDHVNAKGWVDLYRFPKTLYRLWQANWAARPMAFVDPWQWQRRYLGQRKTFAVDSNCAEVELSVNGRAVGRRRPTAANFHSVRFDGIKVVPGTIAARCIGQAGVRDEVTMAGPAARIVLSADESRIPADRSGLSFITAKVVDAAGVPVQGFSGALTWEVIGPARLVGPARYASDKESLLAGEGSGYVTTPVRNIVRSTTVAGQVRVRVKADSLDDGVLTLTTVADRAEAADGVAEPRLADTGRHAVARDAGFDPFAGAGRDAPVIARIEKENVSFPPGADADLRGALRAFVAARNPGVATDTPAFAALIERLLGAVKRTNRQLIPDDYNFSAESFNDAARLARALADVGLPAPYRAQVDAYYADWLLVRGRSVDVNLLAKAYAAGGKGARIYAPAADGPEVPFYESPFDLWRVRADRLAMLLDRAGRSGEPGLAEQVRLLNPHAIADAAGAFRPDTQILVPARVLP